MQEKINKNTEIYDTFIMNIDRLDKILLMTNILTSIEIEKTKSISDKLKKKPDIKTLNKILNMPEGAEITNDMYGMVKESVFNYKNDISELMPFIRNQILIFSVSLYEYYIMDLIFNFHYNYPNFLKNTEKTLTYKEIFSYQLLDELSEKIIIKEVERIGRVSHIEMIKYIKEILNLPLKNFSILDKNMNELNEIRNLLIHNNGKVNEHFLKIVNDDSYFFNEKIELDDKLLKKYMNIIKDNVRLIDIEAKEILFKNILTFSIYHND